MKLEKEILTSREKTNAALKDIMNNNIKVNSMMLVYDCGVVEKLININLTDRLKMSFVDQLENDIGMKRDKAMALFDDWCMLLDLPLITIDNVESNSNNKFPNKKPINTPVKKPTKNISLTEEDFIFKGTDGKQFLRKACKNNILISNKYSVSWWCTFSDGDDFQTYRDITFGNNSSDLFSKYGKAIQKNFNFNTDVLLKITHERHGEYDNGDFYNFTGDEVYYEYQYKYKTNRIFVIRFYIEPVSDRIILIMLKYVMNVTI